jgi:uncharacterized protein
MEDKNGVDICTYALLSGRKVGGVMNLMWTALLMGLMGGFHCISMCGPLALSLPAHRNSSRWQYILGRICYNLGRVTTYTCIGIVFGIFGLAMHIAGLQQVVSIASGLLILLIQFAPGNLSGKVARRLHLPVLVTSIKKSFSCFFRSKSMAALWMIGMLNGLLPCGFVYLALAGSLATGTIAGGAFYMLLFGLGTFPVMLPLSLTGKMISFGFKNRAQKVVPYITVVIALLFILRGLALDIPYVSPNITNDHAASTSISTCH